MFESNSKAVKKIGPPINLNKINSLKDDFNPHWIASFRLFQNESRNFSLS